GGVGAPVEHQRLAVEVRDTDPADPVGLAVDEVDPTQDQPVVGVGEGVATGAEQLVTALLDEVAWRPGQRRLDLCDDLLPPPFGDVEVALLLVGGCGQRVSGRCGHPGPSVRSATTGWLNVPAPRVV